MEGFKLYLLGSPRLEQTGEPLTIGRQKAFALLFYLAVTQQMHRREKLATLLWPDVEPKLAYSYLRRDLSILKKALGDESLETDRHNIGIAGKDDFWVDTIQFRDKLNACGEHGHHLDELCQDCLVVLGEATALYQGDFLSGFNLPDSPEYDEWQFFETQSLRTDLMGALTRLIYGFSAQGKYDQAITYTRQWLRLDPFHEPAHRQLMQLYAWTGNWSAAQRHYEEYKIVLQAELQVLPEETTQQLYQLIQEKNVQEPPVWQGDSATRYVEPRNNLPAQLTPFIGRDTDLVEINRLLRDEPTCRILTLVGPGGVGKTRLALQSATQLLGEFKNGVFLVSLATVASVEHIVPTIADALSLPLQGRAAPKIQLINYLREKELLLLLDNFDHLLKGTDLLLEILNIATKVKLLITSRERLNLSPERVFYVLGLTYPEASGDLHEFKTKYADANSVENFSAVELLLERASRVNPGLSLETEDIAAAVLICQLLQGIPLGLELASSWTRILRFEEIAQEINRNLDFLAGSTRDAPDRHSSLRAVFNQSWQYLSDREKQAYQRLSLFRGGFQRKAAENIFGISLALLAELTDKSLIYRTPSGGYNLHEFSRQYAQEKLTESTENIRDLNDRHSAYYATYLEEREKKIRVGASSEAFSEIGSEIENLRVFWRWAVNQGRIADIGKGLESLHHFYYTVGWVKEGEEVFREAALHFKATLKAEQTINPEISLVYGRILSRQARFAHRLGLHQEARKLLEESLHILKRLVEQGILDAQREKAISLFYQSVILRGDGEYQAAESSCKESLAYFEKCQDLAWIATTQKHLGIIAGSQGKYELSRQWLKSARKQYQAIDDLIGLADTLSDLGNIAIGLGDFTEAKRLNQNCLVLRQKTNHLWGIGTSLNNLGYIALVQAEYDEARQLLEKSLDIQREIGDLYQIANSLSNLGQAAYGQRDLMPARNYYIDALTNAMKIGAHPLLLEIIVGIVQLDLIAGSIDLNRAAALLAFVGQHPACDQMTRERAERECANLANRVPAADINSAEELAKTLELEALVLEMLG